MRGHGADPDFMPAAVHLVLRDAEPSGIVVATRDNWTGVAYALPAEDFTRLPIALEKPGVYGLLGTDEGDEDGPTVLYLGEADAVENRLRSGHAQLARSDVSWRRIVIFTSQADDLHKGHVRWLEAELVDRARSAAQVRLANADKKMTRPNLPEHDRVFVEAFLANMLVLYPLLGVHAFQSAPERPVATPSDPLWVTELEFKLDGEVRARGRVSRGGFTLLAGSQLRTHHTESFSGAAQRRLEMLHTSELLEPGTEGWLVLNKDTEVPSSSLAAVLVAGRSASGPESWRTPEGRKLKELLD
jgi:hypothetical protein